MVGRDRVVRDLEDSGGATVLCLQAPGGYGKTTALAQWAAGSARPVLWLAVRPAAADALWLAQALLDALSDEGLVPDPVVLTGLVDSVTWHLHMLPVVEDALLSVTEPITVVVDDAGSMSGSAWECLVESIAVSLPAGSVLALGTRDTVPATLWRLHARGLVRVVGPEVLAFDVAEAWELMTPARGPDGPRSSWSGSSPRPRGGRSRSTSRAGRTRRGGPRGHPPPAHGLHEYLRAEIVGRLSPEDATFLERVSVLSLLDAQGCDAVTGVPAPWPACAGWPRSTSCWPPRTSPGRSSGCIRSSRPSSPTRCASGIRRPGGTPTLRPAGWRSSEETWTARCTTRSCRPTTTA